VWGFVREGQERACLCGADGRLDQPPLGGTPHLDSWQSAAVCWCPVLKGQELLASLPRPAYDCSPLRRGRASASCSPCRPEEGPWAGAVVDPSLWQLGRLVVPQFTVRHASLHLRLLRYGAQDAAYNVISGHRPRLWANVDSRGGLTAVEARWASVTCSRWEALRSGRQQPVAAAPAVHQGAPTADDGGARVHPLQRAAVAAAAT
jgi:hypothetical protein